MNLPKYSIDEYNAIKTAYAQGVSVVRYGDKTVEYRSLSDMKKILSEIEAELTNKQPVKKRYISYKKGIE